MTKNLTKQEILANSFIIVASDLDGAIGCDRDIPWKHTADMKRFKETTMGCALIVGRTTFETLPSSMPGRSIIVVTSRPLPEGSSARAATSYEEAVDIAVELGVKAIAFAGGSGIYKAALQDPSVTKAYITKIAGRYNGNVFMPPLGEEWEVAGWMDLPCKDGEPEATVFRHDRTSA
jgi:dihydrofolate reductase